MNIDVEVSRWRDQWQRETPPSADLRGRVEGQTRWMRWMRACEILITIVFGGGTAVWAMAARRRDVVIFAALTWLSIALAWSISLANSRGLWSAAAETHAQFLDLSVRRCRAHIRATLLSAVLFCFNLTFTLSWVYREQPIRALGAFLTSWQVCVVWIVALAFFGWLIWYRRGKHAELTRLLEIQNDLEDQC